MRKNDEPVQVKQNRWRDDPDIVAIREGARRWRQENGERKFIGWQWEDGVRIAVHGGVFE